MFGGKSVSLMFLFLGGCFLYVGFICLLGHAEYMEDVVLIFEFFFFLSFFL